MAKERVKKEKGLYQKVRPQTLDEIVGHASSVKLLKRFLQMDKVPRAMIFAGPSGTGKTTMARCLAREMGCPPEGPDFAEINCANCEPMETVKTLKVSMHYPPMSGGGARVWVLDEFQAFSRAGFSQQGMYKILEDPGASSYFWLCTTDPVKINAPIRNRCTSIVLKPLRNEDMRLLLKRTAKSEKFELRPKVLERILTMSDGSPRSSLVLLEKAIVAGKDEGEQLAQMESAEDSPEAVELVRLLCAKASWRQVAKVVESMEKLDAEGVRRLTLGYARKVLLRTSNPRAGLIIQAFRDHFFDCGHAGLAVAAWEVCGEK